MNDVTKIVKDAAYVTVGLGVIAFQRAQVQRQELKKQLDTQLVDAREAISKLTEGMDDRRKVVEERVKDLEERFDDIEERIEQLLDSVEDRLPEQARDVVKQARETAKDAQDQLRTLVARATNRQAATTAA